MQIAKEPVENISHGEQAQPGSVGPWYVCGGQAGGDVGHLPPFDSKLGIPCMMTWWRKRGLLFILMLPERSPLK